MFQKAPLKIYFSLIDASSFSNFLALFILGCRDFKGIDLSAFQGIVPITIEKLSYFYFFTKYLKVIFPGKAGFDRNTENLKA